MEIAAGGYNVNARTTFGSVKEVRGSITVENQNGAIGVDLASPCHDVHLRTSFGSIKAR